MHPARTFSTHLLLQRQDNEHLQFAKYIFGARLTITSATISKDECLLYNSNFGDKSIHISRSFTLARRPTNSTSITRPPTKTLSTSAVNIVAPPQGGKNSRRGGDGVLAFIPSCTGIKGNPRRSPENGSQNLAEVGRVATS